MSFLPQDPEVISFDRPLFYSGGAIIDSVQKLLHILKDKENLTEKEIADKQFLHRVNTIIAHHKIYNLSIDEAVRVGLLE